MGQLVAFDTGDWMAVRADDRQDSGTDHLEILLLGGRPIKEPVEHYGQLRDEHPRRDRRAR